MKYEKLLEVIGVLSGLLTPLIAVLAAYIAYQQWKTGKDQLKHDLFEKRFILYLAAQTYISESVNSRLGSEEPTFKYLSDIRASQWLVSKDVSNYLNNDLIDKACDLKMLRTEIKEYPVGDERSQNVKEQREISDWLEEQRNVLDRKFEKYLNFSL